MSWIAENPILFGIGFIAVVAVIVTALGIELPESRCKGSGEGGLGDDGGDGDGGGD
ncbi:MAG: hypothetical protein AAGK00_06530 [Pseudomonadota bacterium]